MVTPGEIAVELGRPTPDTTTVAQWQTWIDRTLRQVERRLGDLALMDQGTLSDVVLLAVAEHARNPEGVDSYDISVDDGRESRRYRHSSGRIVILDEWWAWLAPASAATVFSTLRVGEPDAVVVPPFVEATWPYSGV